ncbi:hypothetical protein J4440_06805 [Candidatus Woesearchaeota archaeon]|nr:hypothetical protein [Candidatus Woesearchaeota archaeon]
MQKRGQVALFVIVGILIIIAIALLFFFRGKIVDTGKQQIDTNQFLSSTIKNIERDVLSKCVTSSTEDIVKSILVNGGSIKENINSLTYRGKKYRILCQAMENTNQCLSSPLILSSIEQNMNEELNKKITNCLKFDQFEDNSYELIKPKDFNVKLEMRKNSIVADLEYNLKIKRGENIVETEGIRKNLEIPLSDLFNAANDVLNRRSLFGNFDQVSYGVNSGNKYSIIIERPYPDEIYDVSLVNNPEYHLLFSIEGNGRFDRFETQR